MTMINSCSNCAVKCCKIGPGPYVSMDVYEWTALQQTLGAQSYNTKCENFNEQNGNCGLWDQPEMPAMCRAFLCQVREYLDAELNEISNLEQDPCEGSCGRAWKIKGVACNVCGTVG